MQAMISDLLSSFYAGQGGKTRLKGFSTNNPVFRVSCLVIRENQWFVFCALPGRDLRRA